MDDGEKNLYSYQDLSNTPPNDFSSIDRRVRLHITYILSVLPSYMYNR